MTGKLFGTTVYTCCERLIGRMKDVLTKKKLTHSDDINHKMKGYITMPTMLSELDEMSDCVIQGFSTFFSPWPNKMIKYGCGSFTFIKRHKISVTASLG